MEGVSIVDTATLNALMSKVDSLQGVIMGILSENESLKKQWLTVKEVCDITGFGKTWVNSNKHLLGYSSIGGCLRFKRADVVEFMEHNYLKAPKSKTSKYFKS